MKKKTMIRRVLKYLAIAFLGLALLLILAAAGVYFFLPQEKARAYLLGLIGDYIDRQVTVGEVRINILKGIVVNDLVVYNPPSFQPAEFVKVDRLVLKYQLAPLLDRKIVVDEVRFIGPYMSMSTNSREQWNFEDLLKLVEPGDTLAEPEDTAGTDDASPLQFRLRHFAVEDFTYSINAFIKGILSGVSVEVNDLSFIMPDQISLAARVHTLPKPEANCIVIQTFTRDLPEKVKMGLNLDLNARMNNLDRLTLKGKVEFKGTEIYKQGRAFIPLTLGTGLDISYDAVKGNGSLEQVTLFFQDRELLNLSGQIKNAYGGLQAGLSIKKGSFPLTSINNILKEFISGLRVGGYLSLSGTDIRFRADSTYTDLQVEAESRVRCRDLWLHSSDLDLRTGLSALSFKGRHNFMYNPHHPGARSQGELAFTGLDLQLGDSLSVPCGKVACTYRVNTDRNYVPEDVVLAAEIDDLFKARIKTDLALDASRIPQELDLKGKFNMEHLDLAALPGVPVRGRVTTSMEFSGSSYQDIRVKTILDLHGFAYQLDQAWETIPFLHVVSSLALGTKDYTFNEISLNNWDVNIASLASFNLTGAVSGYGADRVELNLKEARMDLAKVRKFIPASIVREQPLLKDLETGGIVTAAVQVTTRLPQTDSTGARQLEYNGSLNTSFTNLFCRVPYLDISASGLNGSLNLDFDPHQVSPVLDITLDQVSYPDLREKPVTGISAGVKARLLSFQDLVLDECTAEVEDLGISLSATGTVDRVTDSLSTALNARVEFSQTGYNELLPDIKVKGDCSAEVSLTMNNAREMVINAKGGITVHNLDLRLEPDLQVSGIQGGFNFHQKLDAAGMELLPGPGPIPHLGTDHLEYVTNRPLVKKDLPYLKSLSISRITFKPYHIGNIRADLYYRNNILDIKEFRIDDLYQGNLVGALHIDLGPGSLEVKDLAERIKYNLYFQLAELNADSLIHSIPALRALPGSEQVKSDQDRLCVDGKLNGQGLDLSRNPEMNGSVNFTKIGSNVAYKLLYIMDPEEKDKSINQTRTLIKRGGRPEYMSFNIRQNYLYAVLQLDLTFPFNLVIVQPIEYPRIPIITLLNNLGAAEYLTF